jgi:predicted RNase H-like HicB family nuclease
MNVTAVYVQEGAWIAAWIEEIPGVNTQGATMEEARANLLDALALMLDDLRAESEAALIGQAVIHREMWRLEPV